MTSEEVLRIADAVLFEGYMLYPYRPSAIKNRQRWNFGTLYPSDFARRRTPEETWFCRAEMIVEGGPGDTLDFTVRFLQLIPNAAAPEPAWEQGVVRRATLRGIALGEARNGISRDLAEVDLVFERPAAESGMAAEYNLRAHIEVAAQELAQGCSRVAVTLANHSPAPDSVGASYTGIRPFSFASAHLILHANGGAFVSLLEPPDALAAVAAACSQKGLFPVLAGEPGSRADMLCSPIILYDYPLIAPESAGDFFDGTEMDEMLSLRVLTLSDEEKQELRNGDPLARGILERTESLPEDYLLKLHGVLRGMSSSTPRSEIDGGIEPWNPFDDRPAPTSIDVRGVELRKGDRIRLRPSKRADILDMALDGRIAIVEAIEQDFEDNVQLAVVLEDDPGKDLGLLRQPGHRFFFGPEEVEPLSLEAR